MRAKKKSTKSFWQSNQFLIGALVVAIVLAVGFARAYFRDHASIKEIKQLQEEAQRLETEQISLLELLDYVQSDAYVEQEARTNLQYKDPEEEVVIFTDSLAPLAQQDIQEIAPNWKRWWQYFFDHARTL